VPFSASHDSVFSVSFGGSSRQKKTRQGDGGLINRVTGLRVLIIIVEHYPALRDAVHEHKTCFNKKRLGRDRFKTVSSSGQVFIRASALDIDIVQQPREVNPFLRI
jgi:hypothetical protein